MAYNKNLYTSSTSALDAGIIYDQTETKMQSEVNAALKSSISSEATTRGNADTALQNTLTKLENKHRKYIFIGDSYGESSSFSYPVWTELVPSYLSLGNGDYYAKGVSGAGFVGSNATFLSVLQSLSVSEPDEITDIYVLGGINDNGSTVSNIVAAISAFMTYAKATYTKAQVHIGIISCTTDGAVQFNMRTKVVPAYMQCPVYGASFVNGMDFIADYELLNNDGTHPTQAGQEVLSKYIADYIIGGYSGTSHYGKTVTITPYEGTLYGGNTLATYEKNGIYTMRLQDEFTTVSFNSNKSIGTVTLFNVPNNKGVFPHGDGSYSTPVSFNIRTGNNPGFSPTVYNGILIYDGVNGVIKLKYPVFAAISNVNAVLLNSFSFTGVTYLD